MSDLLELEPTGLRADGPARVFDLRTRREIHLSPTTPPLSQAQERNGRTDREENQLDQSRTLDQQIELMDKMALQHFPDDAQARASYKVGLLVQRLREYHAKVQAMESGRLTLKVQQ